VDRLNQRQGFLVSAIVHLLILSILGSVKPKPLKSPTDEPRPSRLAQEPKVFLPPPEVLRQLVPPRPPRIPTPPREPTPPPVSTKDRISIGGPSSARAKGPLLLRKEDDLTKVAKGTPSPAPAQSPAAPTPEVHDGGGSPERAGRDGLRLPPGLGTVPRGSDGTRGRPGPQGPSIASSLKNLEQQLQTEGPRGLPTGTVQQMGPLAFDSQGADFTQWVNHFKNEVYRNWVVPESARLGFGGHCDFEFTVTRDGTIIEVRLLKSAGPQRGALDRAARNALLGSRLLPLPTDYGPPRLTITVSFFYGSEGPQGS